MLVCSLSLGPAGPAVIVKEDSYLGSAGSVVVVDRDLVINFLFILSFSLSFLCLTVVVAVVVSMCLCVTFLLDYLVSRLPRYLGTC